MATQSQYYGKVLLISVITVLLATGCSSLKTAKRPDDLPLRYDNAQYGLTFFLPANWQRYSVMMKQWDSPLESDNYQRVIGREHGPIIVLRNPNWKANEPYSDIPIVVFTYSQWNALQRQTLSPYPCGSLGELCRNSKYVFGIWNNAFTGDEFQGWRESANIVYKNMAFNDKP